MGQDFDDSPIDRCLKPNRGRFEPKVFVLPFLAQLFNGKLKLG